MRMEMEMKKGLRKLILEWRISEEGVDLKEWEQQHNISKNNKTNSMK